MKKLMYRLFAIIFNINRIFPVKQNRIALLAPHPGGEHDSLGELRCFAEKTGGYEIIDIKVPRSGSFSDYLGFFLIKAAQLARAKYVFLNDNFMPAASLRFSSDTIVTQLWHGEGAFKKFGLLTELGDEIREREIKCSSKLTYITCTSKNIVPVYAEAFGTPQSKVLALGSPRLDYLINQNNNSVLRARFDKAYPDCVGKKLVLYAPTFRDDPQSDSKLLETLDIDKFNREIGAEYSLLIKLHPRIHTAKIPENAIDVTALDIAELTLISDILVTDYSSVCMDFAYLSKPCIFYAFDLEKYESERSFCFGYDGYVPGPVIKSFSELPQALKNPFDAEKMRRFREFNFDYIDNNNTERVFNAVIGASR